MKKLIGIILTLIIIIAIGTAAYAAQGTATIPDKPVPGAPAQNVDNATYNPPDVEIPDNVIPGGGATTDIKEVKTGGIPAGTFYAAGGLMVAAALVISFKRTAKN